MRTNFVFLPPASAKIFLPHGATAEWGRKEQGGLRAGEKNQGIIATLMTVVSNEAGLEGGSALWRLPDPVFE
jgi:hypothetical protein